jgi:hypothetical protein
MIILTARLAVGTVTGNSLLNYKQDVEHDSNTHISQKTLPDFRLGGDQDISASGRHTGIEALLNYVNGPKLLDDSFEDRDRAHSLLLLRR